MMKLSTLKFLYVCLFVVLFYPFVVTAISQTKYSGFPFPAVIAFGDSILDTGNNNYIETFLKSNFKPYGRDFFEGKATGRFCNGRVPSDLFAEMLGVKLALPPYLDPNLKIEDLLTGVCFASAGSGYDPVTVELTVIATRRNHHSLCSVVSIDDQLKMFKEYIGKLEANVGKERTAFILANSFFLISMGSNDISGTYALTPYRKIEYNVEEYAIMLVNISSNFLQEIYKLGARRIGVLGLSPVGCVPLQRTIAGGIERKCDESINEAALVYNSKLSTSILALNLSLPEARIVYLENYILFDQLVQNHTQFGFDVADSSCCGIPSITSGPLCISLDIKICEDANKFVFWDNYHPSERAYNILVSDIIRKDIDKFL